MSTPTAKQLDDWISRLDRLLFEIGEAYGGRLPCKLENLTLYAWQEARAERQKLDELASCPVPYPGGER